MTDRPERFDAPMPTRETRFLRWFLPFQLLRFVWINLKMLRMIQLSHAHPLPPQPPAEAGTNAP